MSNVKTKPSANTEPEQIVLPIKSPESVTPQAAAIATPSVMGTMHELTPVTLGRGDWFPCTKKSTLNGHLALKVSME